MEPKAALKTGVIGGIAVSLVPMIFDITGWGSLVFKVIGFGGMAVGIVYFILSQTKSKNMSDEDYQKEIKKLNKQLELQDKKNKLEKKKQELKKHQKNNKEDSKIPDVLENLGPVLGSDKKQKKKKKDDNDLRDLF